MGSIEVLAMHTGGPTMKSPYTDAALEEQSSNNELESRTGVPAPVASRRTFIRAAAAAGGAGILSAELAPMSAWGSADKAAQIALPMATKDVTPFKVRVPQAALDDLKSDSPLLAGRTRSRLPIGPRAYRSPKHRRSLNTGAPTTIGAVL